MYLCSCIFVCVCLTCVCTKKYKIQNIQRRANNETWSPVNSRMDSLYIYVHVHNFTIQNWKRHRRKSEKVQSTFCDKLLLPIAFSYSLFGSMFKFHVPCFLFSFSWDFFTYVQTNGMMGKRKSSQTTPYESWPKSVKY